MVRYAVTLTDEEIQDLKVIIQKGGKGYRIKHAQILLKQDHKPVMKAGHITESKKHLESAMERLP